MAEDIVFINRNCGCICAKVDEHTPGTSFAVGQYCIGKCQWRDDIVCNFYSCLVETFIDILFNTATGNDVEERPSIWSLGTPTGLC